MCVEDIVEWWKTATIKDKERLLRSLPDDTAYPVTELTWCIHPRKQSKIIEEVIETGEL